MTLYTLDPDDGVKQKETLLVDDFSPPNGKYFGVEAGDYVVWHDTTVYDRRHMITIGDIAFCGTVQVAKRDGNGYFTEFDCTF